MDLSQYTDEQLMQMAGIKKPSIQDVSDEELMKIAGVETKNTETQPTNIQPQKEESILESSLIRAPVYAMQKILDAPYNPVGIMAKGLNASFGSGKYELPESLRPIEPKNRIEKAIGTGAEFAQDAFALAGLGNALKAKGVLGAGKKIPSKIAQAVLTGSPEKLAISATGSGLAVGGLDSDSIPANILASTIGGNPASVLKAGRGVLRGVGQGGSWLLGQTTGTGKKAVEQAFKAGKKGSTAFIENMRGTSSPDDIIDTAKQGLRNLKIAKNAEYKAGRGVLFKDPKKIDVSPIRSELNALKQQGQYQGFQTMDETSRSVLDKIDDIVSDFSKNKKAQTVEGLDGLKQRIGDISVEAKDRGAKRIKDIMYNAVKNQIKEQAPDYSKVMKKYQVAEDTIQELEKTLSLNDKASKDTALRKLFSAYRDTVQTNFGKRTSLVKTLEKAGAKGLGEMISGQTMQSWIPRGLTARGVGAGIGFSQGLSPALLGFSPRLVGEGAYYTGKTLGRVLEKLPKGSINKQLLPISIGEALRKGEE